MDLASFLEQKLWFMGWGGGREGWRVTRPWGWHLKLSEKQPCVPAETGPGWVGGWVGAGSGGEMQAGKGPCVPHPALKPGPAFLKAPQGPGEASFHLAVPSPSALSVAKNAAGAQELETCLPGSGLWEPEDGLGHLAIPGPPPALLAHGPHLCSLLFPAFVGWRGLSGAFRAATTPEG